MDRKEYCDRVLAQAGRLTSGEANDLRAELAGHIEDHAEALIEHGYAEEEAAARAVELMGDPEETGRALRRLYGGWWLVIARWVMMAVTLVLCLSIVHELLTSTRFRDRDRYAPQRQDIGWDELWGSETPGTRIAIGDDIVRVDRVSTGVPSSEKHLGEYRAEVELTGFDRIPGGVVYARLLESLRLENQRGEAIFEGNEYAYPSSVSGSGTLYVHTARHYVDIEPDDTYVTLIYDRLGERIEVEIPLPEREVQP